MARNNDRDRGKKRTPIRDTNRRGKPKVCVFCRDHTTWVDYKDVNVLRRFISDRAKIKARRTTGTCTQHQREVAVAIKTARELALLPYTQRTVSDKAGRDGRGGGGGGRGGPRGPRADAPREEVAANGDAALDLLDPDLADIADDSPIEVGASASFDE
jgi:small subunit ribosomal protein S18